MLNIAGTDKASLAAAVILVTAMVLAVATNTGTALAGSDRPAAGAGAGQQVDDPLESLNRVISGFNRVFRKVVADPLISGYQAITPEPVQRGVANFASNLTEPVTAVSSMLQGDGENAGNALDRFFINSTIGMGGLSDQAAKMGMEQRREDLGQAAAAAGAGGGAHIVLPIFGPSNVRDLTGDILTSLVDPLYTVTSAVNAGTAYAENRKEINAMTDNAVDPYVAERNAYEQNRQYRINNGQTKMEDIPDFNDGKAKAAN